MAEKTWVTKTKRQHALINADSKKYGPCRHESKFPRFLPTFCHCTDEHGECEKGKCPIAIEKFKEEKKRQAREAKAAAKAKALEAENPAKAKCKSKKVAPAQPPRKPLRTLQNGNEPILCQFIR